VRVLRVGPEDWLAYQRFMNPPRPDRDEPDEDVEPPKPPGPPGEEVFSGILHVEERADEVVETRIDLAPFVEAGHRQLIIRFAAVDDLDDVDDGRDRPGEPDAEPPPLHWITVWVQATGMSAPASDPHLGRRLGDG